LTFINGLSANNPNNKFLRDCFQINGNLIENDKWQTTSKDAGNANFCKLQKVQWKVKEKRETQSARISISPP